VRDRLLRSGKRNGANETTRATYDQKTGRLKGLTHDANKRQNRYVDRTLVLIETEPDARGAFSRKESVR
jgi:hypothetical protein